MWLASYSLGWQFIFKLSWHFWCNYNVRLFCHKGNSKCLSKANNTLWVFFIYCIRISQQLATSIFCHWRQLHLITAAVWKSSYHPNAKRKMKKKKTMKLSFWHWMFKQYLILNFFFIFSFFFLTSGSPKLQHHNQNSDILVLIHPSLCENMYICTNIYI